MTKEQMDKIRVKNKAWLDAFLSKSTEEKFEIIACFMILLGDEVMYNSARLGSIENKEIDIFKLFQDRLNRRVVN